MPDNPSQYPHELIGGGKDGRIFVMNRDNMGQYQTVDHVIQEVQTGTQEYDKFSPPPRSGTTRFITIARKMW